MSAPAPVVGVLAVQGDVREHARALEAAGARAVSVRRVTELDAVDALVLPGGESTTMDKLMRAFDLAEPIRARLHAGMPAYGTCAGMILLADRIRGGIEGQQTLGGIDMTVRRNAFGRQVDSFETELTITGIAEDHRMTAAFIRAPVVEEVGPAATVIGRVAAGEGTGRIVAVRQGPLLATSFHPEVGGDMRVHRMFLEIIRATG